jgi:DNA-binding response OmpR family regulator
MNRQRVLVVDDDVSVRDVLTDLLTSAGYEVTATDSVFGAQALVQRLRPRVILLDLGLPYRSGTSLLAALKADPTTVQIPIIVISALPHTLTAERRAMAAYVIEKPFDVEAVLSRVGSVCARQGPVALGGLR